MEATVGVYHEGQLFSGSRTRWRTESVWNLMGERYGLEGLLSKHPGVVLYGEVYGPGIQDLTYGVKEPNVLFFDGYDTNKGKYLDRQAFLSLAESGSLPVVPTLFLGPYGLAPLYTLAEGQTTLAASHVREGIVVKPVQERWDMTIGRVFLKLPGEGYLLRKNG